jgi:WD40 repeat protein
MSMADAYTDILIRIFPIEEPSGAYPVEAELDDGSRFTGGQLKLDRQGLLAQELNPETYGQSLFNALFPAGGDLRRAYDKATGIAEAKTGGRLRVRLWVDDDAVELHAIPWERIYHPHKGRLVPLGASTLTPFSRYTSLEIREPLPLTETPIRMVAAVSNPTHLPGGLAPANVDLEIENLRRALDELRRQDKIHVTVMPGHTGLAPALRSRLEAEGYAIVDGPLTLFNLAPQLMKAHLLHFIGHGAFRNGTAALYLEKADGAWQAVKDEEIVSMLTALGTLPHAVFLVACESAKREAEATSPFVGLGPKLVQAGIPAVVAMQEEAPVEMARLLSGEFYARLAEHGEVDRALNQARLQVFNSKRTDWAIPVLFMRIRKGRLFGADPDEDAPAPGTPPFKGLEYFNENDADKFYGRELLTAKLVSKLRQSRFLPVIIGASGSGKSSVVRAGLIPALKRGEPLADGSLPPEGSRSWPTYVLTPSAQPMEALAACLTRDANSVSATTALLEDLRVDPRALHFYARKLLSERPGAHRALVIVDQFEEIFTLCKDETDRRAFINNLLYASSEKTDGPTVVIIIFRADFYAHCAQYDNLRAAVSAQQEFVGPMTKEELRRAIEEPAKAGGWDLEPGLVDLILKEVGNEPGALPLMQHALLETWKRRRGRTLTLRGYHDAGGIRGAIAKTAEAVYKELPPEQQAVARRIFLRLVELGEGAQDTRRRALLEELSPRADDKLLVEFVLKKLADNRLVVTTATTAEVAHEALIREWPTFREWIDHNREGIRIHRDLGAGAREWDNLMRETGTLYRGVKLIQALEWAEEAEHAEEMNALENEFLATSKTEAEREAREEEDRRQRELEAARKLAEEQARAAEAAQKLAAAEKQRAAERAEADQQRLEDAQKLAAEQSRAAGQMRRRNRVITVIGVVAALMAVVAFGACGQANLARQQADAASTQAIEQQLVAVTQRAQAEGERANALTQQALANAASTQAVEQQSIAQENASAAERNFRTSLARGLAAAAISNLESDPELSILLALQALYIPLQAVEPGDSLDENALYQAEEALHRSLAVSRILLTLTIPDEAANFATVSISPDGTLLAASWASVESWTITVWDIASGEEIARFPSVGSSEGAPGPAVVFSPDGGRLAFVEAGTTVRVWEAETGEDVLNLVHHEAVIYSVVFNSDGTRLATGGTDGTAIVWDAATGQELVSFVGHEGGVKSVAFSPDGRRLATASDDATARVWIASSGVELLNLRLHNGAVNDVAFSPDGLKLATASDDATVIVWDSATGSELFTLLGHSDFVSAVSFSPDGARIFSASFDGTARAWEATSGRELFTLFGHRSFIQGMAVGQDGTLLATASTDGTLRLWNVGPSEERLTLASHAGQVRRIAFSPDGTKLATSGSDGAVEATASIWDVTTGQELLTLAGHSDVVLDVAFSPDGSRVATASWDSTAIVWDAETGQALLILAGHEAPIRGLAFSPDGEKIATASSDGTVRVWEAATGEELINMSQRGLSSLNGVAFSPDGAKFATTSDDTTASVWEAATGQELLELGHGDWVFGVAFSPDGTKLVTTSQDKLARVWDTATGNWLFSLSGHSAALAGVAFSPDGSRIATASADRTVKVWEAATGQELFTLFGHTDRVRGVAFSPDGTRLATSGDDGTVRLYVTPLEELISLARSRVTRTLSEDECARYSLDPCPVEP